MYICLCNAVTDSDLRNAARAGARTTEQAYAAMGIETVCARCLDHAQAVIDEDSGAFAKAG